MQVDSNLILSNIISCTYGVLTSVYGSKWIYIRDENHQIKYGKLQMLSEIFVTPMYKCK